MSGDSEYGYSTRRISKAHAKEVGLEPGTYRRLTRVAAKVQPGDYLDGPVPFADRGRVADIGYQDEATVTINWQGGLFTQRAPDYEFYVLIKERS